MGGGWRYPTPDAPAPVPSQQRANVTILAAVEATIELLERLPEHQVTIEAIRRRSGVSRGSLTHHFGTRDALIAAAHVERYVRTCSLDEAFLRTHGLVPSSAVPMEAFLDGLATILLSMTTPERHELRWMRMTSIAAANGDEALIATLRSAYTSLTSALTTIVEGAQQNGIVDADLDARTIALLVTTHARGLVLDDMTDGEAPGAAWRHLQIQLFSTFLAPHARAALERREIQRFGDLWRAEVIGPPGRIPAEVEGRLMMLRERTAREGDPDRDATTDTRIARLHLLLSMAVRPPDHAPIRLRPPIVETRARILELATRQLRDGGARNVALGPLRSAVSLSPQSFNRIAGDRDAVVRWARVTVEIDRAARGLQFLASAIDDSPGPAAFRHTLEQGAMRLTEEGPRRSLWQRFETLAATRTDDELRASLARLQTAVRDLLVEQVCRAQQRGLIDPMLPAREVARLLDGLPFWPVFHALDQERRTSALWLTTVRRVTGMLSPDPMSEEAPAIRCEGAEHRPSARRSARGPRSHRTA